MSSTDKFSSSIDRLMKLLESHSFKFQAQELSQKLSQISQEPLTGYWRFEFPNLSRTGSMNPWYLGFFQGQVVFSGNQQLSWQIFLKIFQRYISRLQTADARQAILTLEHRFKQEKQKTQSALLLELLYELQKMYSLTIQELREALRLRILSDFDTYLFNFSGNAQFLPLSQLELKTPILGFSTEDLVTQARERQAWWNKLKTSIPSMDAVPILNQEAVKSSNLSEQQKQWLRALISKGKTLNEIACDLARDSLEISKIFSSLIGQNLVLFKSEPTPAHPEIFVVDDSPLILKQFENLVTSWGYSVRTFHEPSNVLKAINDSKPAVFFLDINMPGITGFELVKHIRRQPQFASIPIIMLTAEQTLTNNWRARWSGCQFLSKPLTPNDVPKFKNELRLLLTELLVGV